MSPRGPSRGPSSRGADCRHHLLPREDRRRGRHRRGRRLLALLRCQGRRGHPFTPATHRGGSRRGRPPALFETSRWGVAVFDAAKRRWCLSTGRPDGIVESLRTPPALGSPRPLYRRCRQCRYPPTPGSIANSTCAMAGRTGTAASQRSTCIAELAVAVSTADLPSAMFTSAGPDSV